MTSEREDSTEGSASRSRLPRVSPLWSVSIATLLAVAILTVTSILVGNSEQKDSMSTQGSAQSKEQSATGDAQVNGGEQGAGSIDAVGDPGAASQGQEHGPVQGGPLLSEALSGQEAIDALGENIAVVAERAGKSVEEIEEMLLRSPSLYVTEDGDLIFRDGFGRE